MLLKGLLGGIISSNELKKSGGLISSPLRDDPIKIGKIALRWFVPPDIDVKKLKYMDLRAESLQPSEIAELSNSIFALKLE